MKYLIILSLFRAFLSFFLIFFICGNFSVAKLLTAVLLKCRLSDNASV